MTTITENITTTDNRTFLYRAAGGLLIAGPVLTLAGMLTVPPQAGDSTADYVASLARDSNMFLGVGLLVVPLLSAAYADGS